MRRLRRRLSKLFLPLAAAERLRDVAFNRREIPSELAAIERDPMPPGAGAGGTAASVSYRHVDRRTALRTGHIERLSVEAPRERTGSCDLH
jgi:hypothetical protein